MFPLVKGFVLLKKICRLPTTTTATFTTAYVVGDNVDLVCIGYH